MYSIFLTGYNKYILSVISNEIVWLLGQRDIELKYSFDELLFEI
mgnify:CR=1 FL=1